MAVNLMDLYYANCKESLEINKLHIIGIVCMFISSKYNEVYSIKL